MTKKKTGGCKRFPYIQISVLALAIAITLSVAGVFAAGNSIVNNFYDNSVANQGDNVASTDVGDGTLGAVRYDKQSFGDIEASGVSTFNEIAMGNKFKLKLNFSNNSLTVPGRLGYLYNGTSNDRICERVEINFTTGSTVGGLIDTGAPFTIAVSTSTSATAFNNTGTGLIASTTIPTSTTPILDSVNNKGTYAATAGQTFRWKAGQYILPEIDSLYGSGITSTSTAFNAMVANLYVICHNF